MSLMVACNKSDNNTKLYKEMDVVEYVVDNVTVYTVDEDGYLYTAGNSKTNDDFTSETIPCYINKYDMEGNLVFSYEFDEDVYIISMAASGNKIYYTTQGYNEKGYCISLYSFDIETKMQEYLCEFNQTEHAKQLVLLDDRIYLLGNTYYPSSFNSSATQEVYQSQGEKLAYYDLNDQGVYNLGVNIPISLAKGEDGTLMIYAYMDSEGYCMLQYDPNQDSIKVVHNFDKGNFQYFAVSNQGKDIIYTARNNSRGLVVSSLSSMDEEAELYSDAYPLNFSVYQVKGHVYFMNNAMNLVRLSMDTVEKNNQVIRYISPGYFSEAPYGCGYVMKRTELEEDKFILKVLAQDKDYDLCLVNSANNSSFNIKKNGVFYPLNDVPGITKYLDSCFPYVKEAATNENGDIWMLPIAVDIPGFLVNEEKLDQSQLNMKNNMTYEEFYEMLEHMTVDEKKKAYCSMYGIYRSFFNQYFAQYTTVSNGVYESKLNLFRQYEFPSEIMDNYQLEWKTGEFLYYNYIQQYEYESIFKNLSKEYLYSSGYIKIPNLDLAIYSMPKLNESDKNTGTCIFLAVNPNSDNLKETLEYLGNWISYVMNQEETPLYFQQPVPEEGSLRKSMYDLYENGEIAFGLDSELYMEGFYDVMDGKLDMKEYIEETDRKLSTYMNE